MFSCGAHVGLRGAVVTLLLLLFFNLTPCIAQRKDPACAGSFPTLRSECQEKDQLQLLLSVDGFSANAFRSGQASNLAALIERGAYSHRMQPAYPHITLPNHYTVVTGMHPSTHGIISSVFWDPYQLDPFVHGTPESRVKSWWGGEPIWKTLESQGKRAAVSSWPGNDVEDQTPSLSQLAHDNIPLQERIDQVLQWAALPPSQRPHLIALSLNTWNQSPEEDFSDKDCLVGKLLKGLDDLGLLSCTNLLVVADFQGLSTEAGSGSPKNYPGPPFVMEEYVADVIDKVETAVEGVFARIKPLRNSLSVAYEVIEQVRCRRPDLRVYLRESAPQRHRIGDQKRFEKVLFEVSPGTEVSLTASRAAGAIEGKAVLKSKDVWTDGALFVAYGPAFKKGLQVESFQNVELYNLLCHLTGITPAPNDGNEGSLDHLLVNPPARPQSLPRDLNAPMPEVPEGASRVRQYSESNCPGDLESQWDWLSSLEEARARASAKRAEHMPWGAPYTKDAESGLLLLAHLDHFTAFSPVLKQALWCSYSLFGTVEGSGLQPWTSDARLTLDQSQPCQNYDNETAYYKIAMDPLFPPDFNKYSSLSRVPFLSSNALQVTPSLRTQLGYLRGRLAQWFSEAGALNVISGPVFDYDFDGKADSASWHSKRGLVVPTHLFVVATRCLGSKVKTPADCPVDSLDTISFVFPQHEPVDNCLSAEAYMQSHLASLADVERLTGLEFFSEMPLETRTSLRLRLHENAWK